MITGDAGEAQEIYYAKFRLEEEGWQVHIAAPEKRAFLSVVHDFEPGFDTYTEKPGYRVQADLGLDEVVAEQTTTGWCCPAAGRRNTCGIARRRSRSSGTSSRAGKPIAANCHGPLLVLAAGGVARPDDDRLSRARARPPSAGRRVRQPRGRRRRPPRHGPRLARQRPVDAGIRPASQGEKP